MNAMPDLTSPDGPTSSMPFRETVYVSTVYFQNIYDLQKATSTTPELFTTSPTVKRPSAARLSEFHVLYDANGRATPPRQVRLCSAKPTSDGWKYELDLLTNIRAADGDGVLYFRRHIWEAGEAEPEIIKQLGIEVIE